MKQMLLIQEKKYPRDCTEQDFERLQVIKRIIEKDLESFLQVMKYIQG